MNDIPSISHDLGEINFSIRKLFGSNFVETHDNISFHRDPGVNATRVPEVKCLTIQVLALSPLCTSSQDPLLCERNPESTKHENKNKLTVSQHFMFLSCHTLLRSVRNGDPVSSWHSTDTFMLQTV